MEPLIQQNWFSLAQWSSSKREGCRMQTSAGENKRYDRQRLQRSQVVKEIYVVKKEYKLSWFNQQRKKPKK